MIRALPAPQRMPRAERLRLQRERAARLERSKRGVAARIFRTLREQSEALRERRARIDDCPELRALIRIARASAQRRVEFGGCVFTVRRKFLFDTIHTASGRHLVSIGGAIFR